LEKKNNLEIKLKKHNNPDTKRVYEELERNVAIYDKAIKEHKNRLADEVYFLCGLIGVLIAGFSSVPMICAVLIGLTAVATGMTLSSIIKKSFEGGEKASKLRDFFRKIIISIAEKVMKKQGIEYIPGTYERISNYQEVKNAAYEISEEKDPLSEYDLVVNEIEILPTEMLKGLKDTCMEAMKPELAENINSNIAKSLSVIDSFQEQLFKSLNEKNIVFPVTNNSQAAFYAIDYVKEEEKKQNNGNYNQDDVDIATAICIFMKDAENMEDKLSAREKSTGNMKTLSPRNNKFH
jgi:hypothetical protein